jgi:Flp pilus assembly pilin Flp
MSETASRRSKPAWAALLRDESGEGLAEYSTALSFFAVQCVVGALVLSRHIDHIVQAIRAIL